MPRKKKASPKALEELVTEGLQAYRDALLSEGAPRAIQRRIGQLQDELRTWHGVLHLLKTKSQREIEELFDVDPHSIEEKCAGLNVREEDLPKLKTLWTRLARAASDKPVESDDFAEVFEVMSRLTAVKPFVVTRFEEKFEEGFRRRQRHRTPYVKLAQDLSPDHYRLNPESAVQNMHNGIKRVLREHQRCLDAGLPSPFLPEVTHQQHASD